MKTIMKQIKQENMNYYLSPSDGWYEFCIKRFSYYQELGDKMASLFYWSIRYIDEPEDPVTDDGYQSLCEYWDYKVSGMK
jgi:hypothetical protein